MRKYKEHFDGREVDLDNDSTYDYLPKTANELEDRMYREIGKALVYMDYLPSRKDCYPKRKLKPKFAPLSDWGIKGKKGEKRVDYNNCGWYQRQRIYKLIKNFAENRHNHYGDVKWLREQVYLFEDECENMC